MTGSLSRSLLFLVLACDIMYRRLTEERKQLTQETPFYPDEADISKLIADLIEEAVREPMPPRIRQLAEQLEAALAKQREAAGKT
jgi:hypothetical protein